MSNQNEIRTIERVLCFSLEIHIWSGRRKLRTTDIGEIDELPNSDLASLGSKKVIDSEHLKPFDKLKKRAQKACESRGVRFLGGYWPRLAHLEYPSRRSPSTAHPRPSSR